MKKFFKTLVVTIDNKEREQMSLTNVVIGFYVSSHTLLRLFAAEDLTFVNNNKLVWLKSFLRTAAISGGPCMFAQLR